MRYLFTLYHIWGQRPESSTTLCFEEVRQVAVPVGTTTVFGSVHQNAACTGGEVCYLRLPCLKSARWPLKGRLSCHRNEGLDHWLWSGWVWCLPPAGVHGGWRGEMIVRGSGSLKLSIVFSALTTCVSALVIYYIDARLSAFFWISLAVVSLFITSASVYQPGGGRLQPRAAVTHIYITYPYTTAQTKAPAECIGEANQVSY